MSTNKTQAAKKFREYWTFQRGSEKGEDQQFWNSLLTDVLGIDDVKRHIQYQVSVPMGGTTKFLDAWIPETRTLIEHKSRGVNLDAPQSGHNNLTPYQQAKEYDNARGIDEKAYWIVVCNFDEIRVHDMRRPLDPPQKIRLSELPRDWTRLEFLANPSVKKVNDRELEISVQAGRIVGRLYDALLKQYTANGSVEATENVLAALNRLCVRLVFCLYAEDSDVFPKDCFRRLIASTDAKNLRRVLLDLFTILDTPIEKRDRYLEPELAAFPYTNGGLFSNAHESEIPPPTDEIKTLLSGSSDFDWSGISPTIFGAVFESTLNPETRRKGGMHYTSVENIHKVIDSLFMNDLEREFEEIVSPSSQDPRHLRNQREKLSALQDKIASLTFLDPACGSGNFLTETYLSLRRLENRIIAAMQRGQRELDLGETVKVSIQQLHGIEINDFAAEVARAALWIAEAQMLRETESILHRNFDFLPLKSYAGIVEGNALRLDWPRTDYIMGNPPFVGARFMGADQKADLINVFGAKWKNVGNLDFVTAWYKKASDLMRGTSTRAALVSTNSICQGESVADLWKPLMGNGVSIDFARRTFRWDSESLGMAHVHCVIVGFSCLPQISQKTQNKTIYDEQGKPHSATNINGYLLDAPNVFVESRSKPLCDVPRIGMGNQPIDNGNYLFTEEEKDAFLKLEPAAAQFFRKWYGSVEFINRRPRWCLWLGDCTPAQLRAMPRCYERIAAVRDYRLKSPRASTLKLAERPTRFQTENMPNSDYLLVPSVSSERRSYIPIGFMNKADLASNLVFVIPDATLYHFGVLTSSVHMAWMRAVCGRLEMRYRYSKDVVYNNFPWPQSLPQISQNPQIPTISGSPSPNNPRHLRDPREMITETAQAILDARAKYPDSSLADLYDSLTMPPDLRAAHAANDAAVLSAYGWSRDLSESEIVARLFSLHASHIR